MHNTPELEHVNATLPKSAHADWAHTPSVFEVTLEPGNPESPTVLITEGHNRQEGEWEAVLDRQGDQEGLPDGPGSDATKSEVVEWIERTVREALRMVSA